MRPVVENKCSDSGCSGMLELWFLGSGFACFLVSIVTRSSASLAGIPTNRFFFFFPPTNEQLHVLEEVQSDEQLLKPSVQNELQPRRTSCLTSPFSDTVFWGYITALTAWLRSTFLARHAHRQPCCMHQWLTLPSGLLLLWRRMQARMNKHWDWRGNRWSVKVICSVANNTSVY